MEYEDRPYQRECLDALGESAVHRNLLVLPTGAGKTYIFSRYSAQIPGRTLMISHRREIIHQTAKTVNQVTGIHPGIVMGKENEIAADTIIASIQSLVRRSRLLQLPADVKLVVIDEAHHIAADSYKRLLYRYGLIDKFTCGLNNAKGITPVFSEDRKLLGVTATPNRNVSYFDVAEYINELKNKERKINSMKNKMVLILLLFTCLSQIAYSKPVVRVVYFKPADVNMPSQAKLDSLRESIVTTEKFYKREMRKHNYFDMYFDTERKTNKIVINIVAGEKSVKEYNNRVRSLLNEIQDDIRCVKQKNYDILIIFLGGSNQIRIRDKLAVGVKLMRGCMHLMEPTCIIPTENNRLFQILAHELGHVFDTPIEAEEQFFHRNNPFNIMNTAIVGHKNAFEVLELTNTQAELLSKHPYFKTDVFNVNNLEKLPIMWANIKHQ